MFRSSWAPARMALCWVRTEEGRLGHQPCLHGLRADAQSAREAGYMSPHFLHGEVALSFRRSSHFDISVQLLGDYVLWAQGGDRE